MNAPEPEGIERNIGRRLAHEQMRPLRDLAAEQAMNAEITEAVARAICQAEAKRRYGIDRGADEAWEAATDYARAEWLAGAEAAIEALSANTVVPDGPTPLTELVFPDPAAEMARKLHEGSVAPDDAELAKFLRGIAGASKGTVAARLNAAAERIASKPADGLTWRGHANYLLACIDMCNEAGAPPDELDSSDIAEIEAIRAALSLPQAKGDAE